MCGIAIKPIAKLVRSTTDILGLTPEKPPALPKTADPNVARDEAATAAAQQETDRRRRAQAGGRASTILAGQQVAQETQQRKTLLGQ